MNKATKERLLEDLQNYLRSGDSDLFFYDSINQFSGYDLKLMRHGEHVTGKIKVHNDARANECHAITAWAWLKDPELTVYAGMAFCNEFYGWFSHSFSVDKKNIIIEPTPLKWDRYFGAPLPAHHLLEFVRDEINNIITLGFDPMPTWKTLSSRILGEIEEGCRQDKKALMKVSKLRQSIETKINEVERKISLEYPSNS